MYPVPTKHDCLTFFFEGFYIQLFLIQIFNLKTANIISTSLTLKLESLLVFRIELEQKHHLEHLES